MSKRLTHIVFSGGGTGGHLFPGLAVAERLSAEIVNLRVTFAGSGKAFEQKHV
jgi:UDP-N-acetylglucosamine--N-acetylmuramyl-(pentapeptide) pyrophosphoryl-undecaprenol N-acetylglucosamine transferase